MDGRVLPETVIENAKTLEGIGKMREEIAKAEADVSRQFRKAIPEYDSNRPDKNVDRERTAVRKYIFDLFDTSKKEFASVRSWLDQQEQALKRGQGK